MSRETTALNPDSQKGLEVDGPPEAVEDSGPFGWLPRLVLAEVRLGRRLAQFNPDGRLPVPLRWLETETGTAIRLDRPEALWRASGLRRPSLVVQLTAPRLGSRLALGIEIPLAHTIVDRMLGFDRPFAESRLQLTPVEWGIWSFLVLRALDCMDSSAAQVRVSLPMDPLLAGPGGLTLDRVGPDPFDPTGLGSIVTIRWPVRAGNVAAAVRLWLAEPILQRWLASAPAPAAGQAESAAQPEAPGHLGGLGDRVPRGELASAWRAVAGFVAMPQGLRRLRAGGVVPLADTRLTGSPRSPSGPVDLIVDLDDRDVRFRIPTRPVADSGGRLLCIEAGLLQEHRPRVPIVAPTTARTPMSQPLSPQRPASAPASVAALDVPVTLTVELGRVNLTLTQLAELKPGDLVELGRHSRAPVELTSNGRLVARGELVSIDTELGVRVTNVFL